MIRLDERRLKALMIAAGVLTLGAASTAVGMATTSGGHAGASGRAAGSHQVALGPVSTGDTRLATTADPFLCVAYAHSWGICIGPPTN